MARMCCHGNVMPLSEKCKNVKKLEKVGHWRSFVPNTSQKSGIIFNPLVLNILSVFLSQSIFLITYG
jgi:hypothetical protein